jgi:ATP/ADP translocase
MKTKIITALVMLIAILVTGLLAFHLFREEDYNASSLLTIASYSSIVLAVYILSPRKTILK